ncbi:MULTISPECIES: DMT family transporter [Bacillus]|uniref:Drug/metabolite exporter family protein n=6 Tax=Bacillus thuringiensis TaxID=1428 RepID=A0AB36TVJ2_BACTU|nr:MULTISPECIES: EamA family transporter [Bacillus]AEA16403.1 drug/metabolite exporter family protein [Bacillus thuringiensis serovar chinensis CT-43]AFV18539.1 drug/metabolite exporter family protein [Bacillus thuringiensis Bt407]AGG01492.1 Permease of the drug/metabolite transporter (DMT) superfamily [Bacillus thuringiensis serovar thuringiensis str. IS5056]AHA72188.1 Permease of the drug/metabolite transporter (DMT) superfamily protein [Bacillus thuringiensis YBT-1518]AKR09734.1 transporter
MVIFNYILVCIIFGTTFLTIKIGIEAGAPPLFSAGIRFFLAGIILMIIFKLKRKEIMPHIFSKRIMYAGFCLTFMTFASLYWSEQYISSGLAAVLSATGPMMILLIQAKRNREKLQKEQLVALVIALIGVIFVSLPGMHQQVSFIWSIACIVLVIGELFYGIGSIRSKEILSDLSNVSPFLINGIQMFYGGILLLIASIIVEQPNVTVLTSWSVQWPILYLIFIGSIGGHGLYYWLLSKTNPVFPSTWLYVSPLIAIIVGYIVLGEPLNPTMGMGACFILIGVFLANRTTIGAYFKQGKLLKKEL